MSRPRTPSSAGNADQSRVLREVLREIARWALTSSIGLSAACGSYHDPGGVSQGVPSVDGVAGSSVDPGRPPLGVSGTGGTSGVRPPPNPPGTGGSGFMFMGTGGRAPVGTGGNSCCVAAGTGAGGTAPMPAPWRDISCAGEPQQPLSAVMFTRSVDYVAILTSYPGSPSDVDAGVSSYPASTSVVAASGEACGNANNLEACRATVNLLEAPNAACKNNGVCGTFLVTTLGDEVSRSEERSSLLGLLGSIDTPEKAAVVALFDGHTISCQSGTPSNTQARPAGDGFDLRRQYDTCGGRVSEIVHVTTDGMVTSVTTQLPGGLPCMTGRRPAGLRAVAVGHANAGLGDFFAHAARLEAASVFAFEQLARELTALSAPAPLCAAAARSALDEIRHARTVGALAQRFGADLLPVDVAALPAREPLAIALENAVEGCVRETYGALVAQYQAEAALDPEVRAVMCVIAEDETRHATLSWQVAAWLEPQLSERERAFLAHARAAAITQLLRELDPGLSADARAAIGWPAPELGAQMIARLGHALALA